MNASKISMAFKTFATLLAIVAMGGLASSLYAADPAAAPPADTNSAPAQANPPPAAPVKIKQPLTSDLIKRAAGIERGAANPKTDKAGVLTREKLREVTKLKIADLNTTDEEMAMRIVAGAARSMGVRIEG